MEKTYRLKEVADRYRISRNTLERWVKEKRITAIKTGKAYVFRECDLAAYDAENEVGKPTAPALVKNRVVETE